MDHQTVVFARYGQSQRGLAGCRHCPPSAPGDVLARRLSILRQDNHMTARLTVPDLDTFGRHPHRKGSLIVRGQGPYCSARAWQPPVRTRANLIKSDRYIWTDQVIIPQPVDIRSTKSALGALDGKSKGAATGGALPGRTGPSGAYCHRRVGPASAADVVQDVLLLRRKRRQEIGT